MQKRAIIVAAKAPRAGAVKTRLSLPPDAAANLAAAFLRDTLRLASSPALQADLTLALDGGDAGDLEPGTVPPGTRITPQRGNSLGERLVHIFEEAFQTGYTAVCVVGSDAPHLPEAFLLEAFGRLSQNGGPVLGPADDGGYYLIGLTRPAPELFADIAWSGPDVREMTLRRAAEAGLSATLLPPWYDIDVPADLRRLREEMRREVVAAPATAAFLGRLTF